MPHRRRHDARREERDSGERTMGVSVNPPDIRARKIIALEPLPPRAMDRSISSRTMGRVNSISLNADHHQKNFGSKTSPPAGTDRSIARRTMGVKLSTIS